MVVLEMLVTVLAFWVGTAVDPVFWILALGLGVMLPAHNRALRITVAVIFGFARCVLVPYLLFGAVRPDWPLLVLALAVEFWAIATLMSHAPSWIAAWRRRRIGAASE